MHNAKGTSSFEEVVLVNQAEFAGLPCMVSFGENYITSQRTAAGAQISRPVPENPIRIFLWPAPASIHKLTGRHHPTLPSILTAHWLRYLWFRKLLNTTVTISRSYILRYWLESFRLSLKYSNWLTACQFPGS